MKLREVSAKRVNNVAEVEGISVGSIEHAAKAAFAAGAEEFARLVQERIDARDMEAVGDLLRAAQTKSFYDENRARA